MLDKDELKIAIEDARARQSALVSLIYFIDTQAMNFLRCYITIEAGAVSLLVAAAASSWTFKAEICGSAIGILATTLIASFYCFRAMPTANITLPGRGAEFWVWALDKDIEHDDVAKTYLRDLEKSTTSNREVNARSARALQFAKLWGAVSPLVGVGGAAVATLLRSTTTFFS